MRSKMVSLEDIAGKLAASEEERGSGGSEKSTGGYGIPANAVLRVAIERELTQRQRDCVRMYFYDGMTMERIGQELGIGKPTVYRHLQKAKARIIKAFEYAQALNDSAKNN